MATRKSPSAHASETHVGIVAKGNDKNYWIVLEKNKIKRWYPFRKATDPKEKTYMIHFNGGKPFRVVVAPKMIVIYTYSDDYDYKKNPTYNKFVMVIQDYDEVLVGAAEKGYVGNTLIVKIKKNSYVLIWEKISKFTTNEDIIKYYSPMTDKLDGMAYPYAVTKNYTYLMADDVYVPNDQILLDDVYEQYYKAGIKGAKKYTKKLIVDCANL